MTKTLLPNYFLIFFSLLFLKDIQAQGWEIATQHPSVLMNDIQMLADGETGYAVGGDLQGGAYLSVIYKTTDGGDSWDLLYFPAFNVVKLNSVHFVNPEKGFVVGNDGKIYFTFNGGGLWTSIPSGTTRMLQKVFFANENVGWICGGRFDGNSFLILKTTDGGLTWTDLSFGTAAYSTEEIYFLDENTGWMSGQMSNLEPHIHKTTDGGLTWIRQTLPYQDINMGIPDIRFATSQKGWAATSSIYDSGPILYTENGGDNWNIQSYTGMHYHRLAIRDSMNIAINAVRILSPGNHQVLVSEDGGFNWDFYTPPVRNYTGGIEYQGDNIWMAVKQSALFKSEDRGATWDKTVSSALFQTIAWANPSHGWVGSGHPFGIQPFCLRTTDGGNSWFEDKNAPGGSQVTFVDENHGWILEEGNGAGIWRTINGGQNWNLFSIGGGSAYIGGISFLDAQKGWAYGSDGTVRHTQDGGQTWIAQNLGVGSLFVQEVQFLDENVGYAAGGFGSGTSFIAQTVNGGQSWILQNPATPEQVLDIFFLDELEGWAVTVSGKIQKTEDAGMTWNLIGWVDHDFAEKIVMVDQQNGYLLARNTTGALSSGGGYIYKTTDGGASWDFDYHNPWPHSSIADITVQPQTGVVWACGDHHSVLYYGNLTGTKVQSHLLDFQLSQNYPNPFSNLTRIPYEIKSKSTVRISIYDATGNLVKLLANENQIPGEYQIHWDGKHENGRQMPNGVYFLIMEAGGQVKALEMTMVR